MQLCPFCHAYLDTHRHRFGEHHCAECDALLINPDAAWSGRRVPGGDAGWRFGEVCNYPTRRTRAGFRFQVRESPANQALAERFGFADLIADAATDWERAYRLRHYLYRNFSKRPAREIVDQFGLRYANRPEDPRWFCTHFTCLFLTAAAAVGLTARMVNCGYRRPDKGGHMVNDFWCGELQKWVAIDNLSCTHYELKEHPGTPLCFLETRQDWIANGGRGVDLVSHRIFPDTGTVDDREEDIAFVYTEAPRRYDCANFPHPKGTPLTDAHFWLAFYMGNDFSETEYTSKNNPIALWIDDACAGERWLVRGKPVAYYDHEGFFETSFIDDIYPTLNNAEIYLQTQGGRLLVGLDSFTPNFQRFETRLNGGEWRETEPCFVWPLTPGRNRLEARARNRYDRCGPASLVEACHSASDRSIR